VWKWRQCRRTNVPNGFPSPELWDFGRVSSGAISELHFRAKRLDRECCWGMVMWKWKHWLRTNVPNGFPSPELWDFGRVSSGPVSQMHPRAMRLDRDGPRELVVWKWKQCRRTTYPRGFHATELYEIGWVSSGPVSQMHRRAMRLDRDVPRGMVVWNWKQCRRTTYPRGFHATGVEVKGRVSSGPANRKHALCCPAGS